ncbi:MAG: ATP-binding protein, partial [Candidatus Margulisbacteria bacterium]|nr:ATP-binding protein [Candidatus Margulisiibacteriota bacterium]
QHGTGLGLYITREIIEKHNGKIHLHTEKGGNRFIIDLELND